MEEVQRLVGGHEEALGGGGRTAVRLCAGGKEREGRPEAGGGGGRRRLTDPRVAAAEGWCSGTRTRWAEPQGVSAKQEVVDTYKDGLRANGREEEEGEDV